MNISRQRGSALPLFLLFCTACGDSGPTADQQKEIESGLNNLTVIDAAYQACIKQTGKPPQSAEELGSYFPENVDKGTVFTSSRDGKPYKIDWGVDYVNYSGAEPLVVAYEEIGKDGQRVVLTNFGSWEMPDEEFKAANISAGIKP